ATSPALPSELWVSLSLRAEGPLSPPGRGRDPAHERREGDGPWFEARHARTRCDAGPSPARRFGGGLPSPARAGEGISKPRPSPDAVRGAACPTRQVAPRRS